MKRIILPVIIVSIVAAMAVCAQAQPKERAKPAPFLIKTPSPVERLQTSPRHHEWVDIESAGGRKVRTWVVFPEVNKQAPVVIVIHENRGLTDWVRGVADQIAEAGYVAVAPDLLSGTAPGGGNTPEYGGDDKATQGIYKLKQPQVTADLDAVYEYAKKMEAGNGVVAVGGFCWGGGQTFAYATHNPKIAAAFVFYGTAPKDEDAYKKIEAPVYGFYGGNDFRISGAVPEVEKHMKQLNKKYEPVIYKEAGHGFMRQGETATDPQSPDRKARDEAWLRLKKLLAELKPAAAPDKKDGAAQDVKQGAIAESKGGMVTGIVLAEGKPLANAQVDLYVEDAKEDENGIIGPLKVTKTNDAGVYRFEAVPLNARVKVLVERAGYSNNGSTYRKVLAGKETKLPNVVLAPRNSVVAGTIVDPNGKPVANVTVYATEKATYRSVSYGPDGEPKPTDADGRFRLEDMPNVVLELTAYIRPKEGQGDGGIHFPATATVKPGQTNVRIVLDPKLQRPLP
jgi:carboxymethylenebutenolidase